MPEFDARDAMERAAALRSRMLQWLGEQDESQELRTLDLLEMIAGLTYILRTMLRPLDLAHALLDAATSVEDRIQEGGGIFWTDTHGETHQLVLAEHRHPSMVDLLRSEIPDDLSGLDEEA